MPETRRLVNKPVKFEDLWFTAFGQPSAWGEAARRQLEAGHPPARWGPRTTDTQPGRGIPGCTTFGEAVCFPTAALAALSLLQGRGATRLGRVSGHRWRSLLDTQAMALCCPSVCTTCHWHKQLDREAYNPSRFVAPAMAAASRGPSHQEAIKSEAVTRRFTGTGKLCSPVIP